MVINAHILSITHVEGTSTKSGKPYSFHSLAVLDKQNTKEAEILKINVNDDQAAAFAALVDKVVPINVTFNRGNFSFLGLVK